MDPVLAALRGAAPDECPVCGQPFSLDVAAPTDAVLVAAATELDAEDALGELASRVAPGVLGALALPVSAGVMLAEAKRFLDDELVTYDGFTVRDADAWVCENCGTTV